MPRLTSYPFHTQTGRLLPVYLDAYLIDDLVITQADLVTAHLNLHPEVAQLALRRWDELKQLGLVAAAATPPWLVTRPVAVTGMEPVVAPEVRLISWKRLTNLNVNNLRPLMMASAFVVTILMSYGLNLVREQHASPTQEQQFRHAESRMELASLQQKQPQF